MKVRLYIKANLHLNSLIELTDESKRNYINNVLKLKTGFKVFIFNETDGEFEGTILVEKKSTFIKIIKHIKQPEKQENTKINLVFANIKNNLVSDVLNSCTQIGVSEFFPITTKHTTNHHFNLERGGKIIEEAVEQSKRIIVPKIHKIQTFSNVLKNIQQDDTIIFCDEKSSSTELEILTKIKNTKAIFIFIGPEGGFSDEEREVLKLKNAITVSLGKFILRAETASICATFLVCNINNFIS